MISFACYCRCSAVHQERPSAPKVRKGGPWTLQVDKEFEWLLQPLGASWCQVSQLKLRSL